MASDVTARAEQAMVKLDEAIAAETDAEKLKALKALRSKLKLELAKQNAEKPVKEDKDVSLKKVLVEKFNGNHGAGGKFASGRGGSGATSGGAAGGSGATSKKLNDVQAYNGKTDLAVGDFVRISNGRSNAPADWKPAKITGFSKGPYGPQVHVKGKDGAEEKVSPNKLFAGGVRSKYRNDRLLHGGTGDQATAFEKKKLEGKGYKVHSIKATYTGRKNGDYIIDAEVTSPKLTGAIMKSSGALAINEVIIEKYNQNHGAGGKFSSGRGGSASVAGGPGSGGKGAQNGSVSGAERKNIDKHLDRMQKLSPALKDKHLDQAHAGAASHLSVMKKVASSQGVKVTGQKVVKYKDMKTAQKMSLGSAKGNVRGLNVSTGDGNFLYSVVTFG